MRHPPPGPGPVPVPVVPVPVCVLRCVRKRNLVLLFYPFGFSEISIYKRDKYKRSDIKCTNSTGGCDTDGSL